MNKLMDAEHPKWDVFIDLLRDECDCVVCHPEAPEYFTDECAEDFTHTKQVLSQMGMDVEASVVAISLIFGCDCEVATSTTHFDGDPIDTIIAYGYIN